MNLIFKNPETLQHMHEGPLGPYLDSYAAEMHLCLPKIPSGPSILLQRTM
jgi:hypothetical protein